MLPYHPNPLPSCRPAEDRGLAASGGGDASRQGTHHARTIPSANAAQANTRSKRMGSIPNRTRNDGR
eukprot:766971-Hanusia_phi.AAC.1